MDRLESLGIGDDRNRDAEFWTEDPYVSIRARVTGVGNGNSVRALVEFEADDRGHGDHLSEGGKVCLSFYCGVSALHRLGRAVRWWSESGDEPLIWTPAP